MKDVMQAQVAWMRLMQRSMARLEAKVVDGEKPAQENAELNAAFEDSCMRVERRLQKSVNVDVVNDVADVDEAEDEDGGHEDLTDKEDADEGGDKQVETEEDLLHKEECSVGVARNEAENISKMEVNEFVDASDKVPSIGVEANAEVDAGREVEPSKDGDGNKEVEGTGDMKEKNVVEADVDDKCAEAKQERPNAGIEANVVLAEGGERVQATNGVEVVAEEAANAIVERNLEVQAVVNHETLVANVLADLQFHGDVVSEPDEEMKGGDHIVEAAVVETPVLGGEVVGEMAAKAPALLKEHDKGLIGSKRRYPIKQEKMPAAAAPNTSPLKMTRRVTRELAQPSPPKPQSIGATPKARGKKVTHIANLPALDDTSAPYPVRGASNEMIARFEAWKQANDGRAGGDAARLIGVGEKIAGWFRELFTRRGWLYGDQGLCQAANVEAMDSRVRPYVQGSWPIFGGAPWWEAPIIAGIANIRGAHWVAYQIVVEQQTVLVFDSMAGAHPVRQQFEPVLINLASACTKYDVFKIKGIEPPYKEIWELELVSDLPQQVNNHDCGVFVLKYLQCLISNTDMSVLAGLDIGLYRKSICGELYFAGLENPNVG